MSAATTAALRRELLVRLLDAWLPRALHRSRRLTLVQAYAGEDAGIPGAALDVLAEFADRLGGRRVTVAVLDRGLTGGPSYTKSDNKGPFLPAGVSVHPVKGGPALLPAVLAATQAAGAPLLAYVDLMTRAPAAGHAEPAAGGAGSAAGGAGSAGGGAGPPGGHAGLAGDEGPDGGAGGGAAVVPLEPVYRAVAAGRPGELLLVLPAAARDRDRPVDALAAAGFPLVTEVELVPVDGAPAELVVFATASGHGLDAFKDALWNLDEYAGVRYRDPRDPEGHLLDISLSPHPGPLRRELLARLATGPASVAELRRFAAAATVYRSADVNSVLTALLAAGTLSRAPEHGRLSGDVVISAAATRTA
ncbi:hypothetical protein ACFFWC_31080 [Plantactinospora siamensis]|uniref:Uncharacterized protein n=1 Tax=Plantactinospora siamensis TaxID=555372 RepID=A0ABV6NYL3_9ACTN